MAAMTDADIRALVTMGDMIAAVRLYQERHGGSVLAARKAVDAMRWDHTQSQGKSLSVDETELDALLARGEKIAAIKRYRELHGVGLKEAKDAIDARAAALAPAPAPAPAPAAYDPVVLAYLRDGSKISAIKHYREIHGCGLKEAKDAVEAIPDGVVAASAVKAPDATQMPGVQPELDRLLRIGMTVAAIQHYRDVTGFDIGPSTDAVFARKAALAIVDDGPTLQPELDRLIGENRKIEAIKHHRTVTGAGLKESKDFVEARMEELARGTACAPQPDGLQPELDRLIGINQKIMAIKHYRTITNVGLKEAKDAVEARMAELGR